MRPLRAEEGSWVIIPRTTLQIRQKTLRCSFKGHFVLLGRALTFPPSLAVSLSLGPASLSAGLCHEVLWNPCVVDPWGLLPAPIRNHSLIHFTSPLSPKFSPFPHLLPPPRHLAFSLLLYDPIASRDLSIYLLTILSAYKPSCLLI